MDQMIKIYEKYGYYEGQISIVLKRSGAEIKNKMSKMRANPQKRSWLVRCLEVKLSRAYCES